IFMLIVVIGIRFAPVREKRMPCRMGKDAQTMRSKAMGRTIGKMFGGAMAVLCLVSTLAVAMEMTCAKDDGKGDCIAATGPDGKTLVVVGEGLKWGEKMDC